MSSIDASFSNCCSAMSHWRSQTHLASNLTVGTQLNHAKTVSFNSSFAHTSGNFELTTRIFLQEVANSLYIFATQIKQLCSIDASLTDCHSAMSHWRSQTHLASNLTVGMQLNRAKPVSCNSLFAHTSGNFELTTRIFLPEVADSLYILARQISNCAALMLCLAIATLPCRTGEVRHI